MPHDCCPPHPFPFHFLARMRGRDDDCCGPRPPFPPPPWILEMIGARGRPERGEVRWLILQALEDGPKHGYAIIQAIEQRTKGAYKPSAGSVYPTLQMLEELDQVSATAEGSRKLYALTEAGRKELEEHAPEIEDCCERLDDGVGWTETFDFHALGHRVRRVLHGVHAGVRRGRLGGPELKRIREALDRALAEVEGILSGKKG